MNWYKLSYQIENSRLAYYKEAGTSEEFFSAIVFAVALLIGGADIAEAANKSKVPLQTIEVASKNPAIREKAQALLKSKTPKQTSSPNADISNLINAILKHENLVSGQTPFKITSPEMRKWNHVYGYDIDKNPKNAKGREGFLFLVNPEDVPKAVRVLFNRYKDSPTKYKLPNNPTLRQAIEKFDQSGAAGKIKFLKGIFQDLDVSKPLSDFFI